MAETQEWVNVPAEGAAPKETGWVDVPAPKPPNLADPAQKAIVDESVAGRLMNAFMSGANEAYTHGGKPGMSDKSVEWLRNAGVFNSAAPDGSVGATLRGYIEGVTLPTFEYLESLVIRTPLSMYLAGGHTLVEAGKILDEKGTKEALNKVGLRGMESLGRDIAAMPQAFMGGPSGQFAPKIKPPTVSKITGGIDDVPNIPVARDLGIIGPELRSIGEGTPAEAAAAVVRPVSAQNGSARSFDAFVKENNPSELLAKPPDGDGVVLQVRVYAEDVAAFEKMTPAEKAGALEITHRNGEAVLPPKVKETPPPVERVPVERVPGENPWADNFDQFVAKLNTSDDVKTLIREAAKEQGEFLPARNGEIPLAHQAALSDATGIPAAELQTHLRGMGRLMRNDNEVRTSLQVMLKVNDDIQDAMRAVKAKNGKDDFAQLQVLQEAIMRRDLAVEQVVGLRAEWGRTGNVFQEFQLAVKDNQSFGQWIKDKKGTTLDDLRNLANAGAGVNSREGIASLMQGTRKPGFYDKFLFYWMNSLLSGPFTQTKYLLSDGMWAAYEAGIVTPVAGAVGAVRNLGKGATEVDRVFMGEGAARIYGLVFGMPDALIASMQAIKNGKETLTPREIVQQAKTGEMKKNAMTEGGRNPFGTGALANIIGAPSERGISAISTLFNFLGYRSEIEALAYRAAAKEGHNVFSSKFIERQAALARFPTEQMLDKAVLNGKRLNMTDDLGPNAQAIQNFLHNQTVGRGLRLLVPFFKTPVNATKRVYEATPLAWMDKDMRANLRGENGGAAKDTQIARLVVGGSLMGWVMTMALGDNVTGSGPSDPKERALWLMTHQPNSIRIGENWVSYNRFGNFGTLFGLAANLKDVGEKLSENELAEAGGRLVGAASYWMQDTAGLQGVADMMQAMKNPDQYAKRYVTNFATTLQPYSSLTGQTAAMMDPYMRETKTFFDAIQYKYPIARQNLFPVRDWTGSPRANSREELGAVMPTIRVNTDPVDLEIQRLEIKPTPPAKSISGVELTPAQYDRYQTLAGPLTRQMLRSMIEQPSWAETSDFVKDRLMRNAISMSRRLAAQTLQAENGGELLKAAVQQKTEQIQGK